MNAGRTKVAPLDSPLPAGRNEIENTRAAMAAPGQLASESVSGQRPPLTSAASLHPWLGGLLLVAAIFLAYQSAWRAGFIWDDDAHLTNNPCIVGPLGFKGIWTSSSAVYYPLVLSSFWVLHAMWGLNPLPYHLVNIGMHAACALLLWRVLRRLNVPGAWLGAAVWALHPVQVESVAWITELKNTQSCFFYLLAVLCFLRWRDERGSAAQPGRGARYANERWYALTLLCAALALISKPSTVMLPFVLGLCAWWLDRGLSWRQVTRLIPLVVLSGLASLWTIWEQKHHSGALGPEWAQTWPERWIIAGRNIWFYLGKLLWPEPLIFIYPRWKIDAARWLAYVPIAAAVAGLVVTWLLRRQRAGAAGFVVFASFVALLFPVLGFFNVYFFRYSYVGDHFQYLASMAPLALAAAGLAIALNRLRRSSLLPVIGVGLLLVLGVLDWRQAGMYRDLETLYRTTIRRNPDCWLMHNNLGALLIDRDLDEAAACFQRSLQINPRYADPENNLGNVALRRGRSAEAIMHFRQALARDPEHTDALNNLAWILATASQASLRDGTQAVRLAERANQLTGGENPNLLDTLAAAYAEAGRFDEARRSVDRAIELARATQQPELIEPLRAKARLYAARIPFHDKTP